MKFLARRLTYANVMSTLAVFVALGGVSYAAVTIPANSVGTAQIRAGAVSLPKLGFALGSQTGKAAGPISLPTPSCAAEAPCPAASPRALTSVTLTLKKAGRVLLIGSGDLSYTGSPGGVPEAQLLIGNVNGNAQSTESNEQQGLNPGNAVFTSVPDVVTLPAGKNVLSLSAVTNAVGVSVTDAELTAIVLP